MEIGILLLEEPGVFRSLLLPETADALAAGEPLTALALTENGLALGAAAGYLEGGRFRVSSLYVSPDHRRRGGGRLLVETMAQLAVPYAGGMELRFTSTREEHETLPPFLTAMGFQEESDDGENIYMTTLGEAAASAFFSGAEKSFGSPLSALNPGALSLAEKAALAAEAPLPEGGLSAANVDRESSVAFFQGSEPQAYVVLEHIPSGGLTLSAAWSRTKNPTVLPQLLRSVMARAREKYPPETTLTVQAINQSSAALIRALIPGAGTVSHTWSRSLNK